MAYREATLKLIWAQMALDDNFPKSTMSFFKLALPCLMRGATMTEISKATKMTKRGVIRHIWKLEDQGYIEKLQETIPFVFIAKRYDEVIVDSDLRELLGLPEHCEHTKHRDVVGSSQRRGHTASISTVAKR